MKEPGWLLPGKSGSLYLSQCSLDNCNFFSENSLCADFYFLLIIFAQYESHNHAIFNHPGWGDVLQKKTNPTY